jgi:hypothetical protein
MENMEMREKQTNEPWELLRLHMELDLMILGTDPVEVDALYARLGIRVAYMVPPTPELPDKGRESLSGLVMDNTVFFPKGNPIRVSGHPEADVHILRPGCRRIILAQVFRTRFSDRQVVVGKVKEAHLVMLHAAYFMIRGRAG